MASEWQYLAIGQVYVPCEVMLVYTVSKVKLATRLVHAEFGSCGFPSAGVEHNPSGIKFYNVGRVISNHGISAMSADLCGKFAHGMCL